MIPASIPLLAPVAPDTPIAWRQGQSVSRVAFLRDVAGVASAVFNTSRELAGLLGIAVIGAILTSRQSHLIAAGRTPMDAYLGGYRLGLVVAGALVLSSGSYGTAPPEQAALSPVEGQLYFYVTD